MFEENKFVKEALTQQTHKLAAIIRLQERRIIEKIMGDAGFLDDADLDNQYYTTLNNLDRLMDLESE